MDFGSVILAQYDGLAWAAYADSLEEEGVGPVDTHIRLISALLLSPSRALTGRLKSALSPYLALFAHTAGHLLMEVVPSILMPIRPPYHVRLTEKGYRIGLDSGVVYLPPLTAYYLMTGEDSFTIDAKRGTW